MLRLMVFGIFLIIFFNEKQIDAVRELYGQSSGRIRSSSNDLDFFKMQTDLSKHPQTSHLYGRSPTFMQSRRYHANQVGRATRNLGRPSSDQAHVFSSAYPAYSGTGVQPAAPNQEGCRLTDSYCSGDYQCCSGKCRCVRWSVMGKMSCYRKCF